MNFHIFGKGFGLYGYLASLINKKNSNVIVKQKYYKFIKSRSDLKKYLNKIKVVKKHDFKKNDVVIFAKRPSDQYKFLKKNASNLLYFFLEKPLAESYIKAKELQIFLIKKKVRFSIGYLFLYTTWYKKLILFVKNKKIEKIFITWNFKSINKPNSWKNDITKGGGLLNFYGIHIVSLMASLKFDRCLHSKIYKKNKREVSWFCEFKNKKNMSFFINLNPDCNETKFNISYLQVGKTKKINKNFYTEKSPFGKLDNSKIDHRVKVIKRYLRDNKEFDKRKIIYLNTLSLFKRINSITKIEML